MVAEEGYVTTEDGLRLFYRKLGNGPTVLVPNGLYLFDDFERLTDHRAFIFYDLRNRGFSDRVTDPEKLERGIHNDVDDLEAVRKHFEIGQMDLIGHSYIAIMIALYTMKYHARINRMIQIGPMQPYSGKKYPPHLTGADTTLAEVFSKLGRLQSEQSADSPQERCKKFWSLLRVIYVANAADAEKIKWERCDLPNERNFMKYWSVNILPSIENLNLTAESLEKIKIPTLIVHGAKDRSSPYGGGREWAFVLSNARLLTVENAAHAPWIEEPDVVFEAIMTFLAGAWPDAAKKICSLSLPD